MGAFDFRPWALLAAAVLASLAYGFHKGQLHGAAAVQGKWDAAVIAQGTAARRADADNRTIEFNRLETTNAAIENARQRGHASAARAPAAAAESAGLRDDRADALATFAGDMPGQSPDACRRFAATLDSLLGDVEAEGAGMASAAEGHASDSLMFQEAWPK